MANTVDTMAPEAILRGLIDSTLTGFEDDTVGSLARYRLRYHTGLKRVSIPNATRYHQEAAINASNLTSLKMPSVTSIGSGQIGFINSSGIRSIALPGISGTTPAMTFKDNGTIQQADFGTGLTSLTGNWAYNASALNVIILRRSASIVAASISLDSNLFGSNCPFHSGKSGGVIYIPKVLYDHLGDGTSLDYYHATNWSAASGRASILFMPIEGSFYEYRYADGTFVNVTPKEADSISVVYTGNSTIHIYPSTNIDTFRNLIVVTGHSGSEEFIVPSHMYELSGTLGVGTSTLTVTYEGKTATFNVTVESYQTSLPSGYTQLTCIIGDGRQEIGLTDIPETQEFYAEYGISEAWQTYLYANYICMSTNQYFPSTQYERTGEKSWYVRWRGTDTKLSYDWQLCTLYNVTADLINTGEVTINGVSIGNATKGSTSLASTNYYNILASTVNIPDRRLYGALYYMRLYQGDTLVHNYVPCKKSTGEVGLYDTVTDIFLQSSVVLSGQRIPYIAG